MTSTECAPTTHLVPRASIERFVALVHQHVPSFDADAARDAFCVPGSLYPFDLEIPPGDEDAVAARLDSALALAGIPARTGDRTGSYAGKPGQRLGKYVLFHAR